jgi:hypothetical protein
MKRIITSIALGICFGGAAYADQEPAPAILIHAAHCLAAKGFLPDSNNGNLTLGYFLDNRSYPGKKMLYVVVFASSHVSNGLAFTVYLTTKKDDYDNFNIQNNAGFVLDKDEPIGVSFVNPPLGGAWTEQHLASAILAIEHQPRFAIPLKTLFAENNSSCESYADPQPAN